MLHNLFLTEILPTLPFNWHIHSLYIGHHWTIAICEDPWGEKCAGLASSPTPDQMLQQREFGFGHNTIRCWTPIQLANLFATHDPVCKRIGLAILNALLAPMVESLPTLDAMDWLLEACWEQETAVVGHFPFTPRLKQVAQNVNVFNTVPERGEYYPHEAPCVLPQADIVVITGATLMDDTLNDLLFWIRSDAKVMLVGPSTPLTVALLNAGVDIVASSIVTHIPKAYEAVVSGQTFQTLPGVQQVALENELATFPQRLWQA